VDTLPAPPSMPPAAWRRWRRGPGVRWFWAELVTITAGILIALAIDGLLEQRRERALVREAHAAIAFEVTENLRDLEATLPSLNAHEHGLKDGLRLVEQLLRHEAVADRRFQAPLSTPSLNQASWVTADRTGALAFMQYADVKRYSELYLLQDLVVASQYRLLERLPSLAVLALIGTADDLTPPRAQDLEAARSTLMESIGAVSLHRELAVQLADAYKRSLKR
jgi:hypothetical protein